MFDEISARDGDGGTEDEDEDEVPRDAVVFVLTKTDKSNIMVGSTTRTHNRLRTFLASNETGEVELDHSNCSLEDDKKVGDHPKDGVRRLEMVFCS